MGVYKVYNLLATIKIHNVLIDVDPRMRTVDIPEC